MSAKWAREVFYLGAPFRDYFDKGVVVDEADIEALAAVFNNIPDGEVLIRLVQVVAGPGSDETIARSFNQLETPSRMQ